LAVAGRQVFWELQKKYSVIDPFDEGLLDGDGYVLTVKDDVKINYLQHINLISKEIVFVPPSYVAHLTAKSRFGRMGLSFLNAAKVHSGFVGRLALEVVNLNNDRKPVSINRSDPFMHFELIAREGTPAPYHGRYMFQCMEEVEVEKYLGILGSKFNGIYSEGELRRLAANRVHTTEEFEG
jgi:dCTP deaminase